MNNLKTYIFEKLKINKDSKLDNCKKIYDIIKYYLNQMIITKDEKYIIDEVEELIKKWINEFKIDNVYCYIKEKDFKKTFIEKNWKTKEDFNYNEYFDDISDDDYNKLYDNLIKNGKIIYSKKMTNQYVSISMLKTKDIISYCDSFLSFPILFVNK